jgi:polysaccharide export outer membrane protein
MFLIARLLPCLVALLLGLGACDGPGEDLPPMPPPAAGPYRLGTGDLVRIIVYGDRELTGSFAVGGDGTVSLPLAGTVPATGRDSDALAQGIAARLESRGMMRAPSVAVEVERYRPVFLLGEVTKPGEYAYEPGMTVVAAVSVAGGYTYRGIHAYVGVLRQTPGGLVRGRAGPDDPLAPGDVVTVYDRRF